MILVIKNFKERKSRDKRVRVIEKLSESHKDWINK